MRSPRLAAIDFHFLWGSLQSRSDLNTNSHHFHPSTLAPPSHPHRPPPPPPHEISASERFYAAVEKLQDIYGAPPASNLSVDAETANRKKRVSYFEDALTPSNFSTPHDDLARARVNLRNHLQPPFSRSATVGNLSNVISTLGATTSSLSAFGLSSSAGASSSLYVADCRSVSLSDFDLSDISLDYFGHHDNKQASATGTSDNKTLKSKNSFKMPNCDRMFRRKPAPINSDTPMPMNACPKTTPLPKAEPVTKPSPPKSSVFTNLREARNVSLPDTLNTFSKQFFSAKQPYTQKGYLKEIDLNLNDNGTSAPFLKQDASAPGRTGHFVENFDDDTMVDERITGPLGGVQMSECRGLKEPMTMDGKGYTGNVNPKRISESDNKSNAGADAAEVDTARPSNPAFGVSTSPVAKRTVSRPVDMAAGPSTATTSTTPSERPSDATLRPSITFTGPTPRASEATLRPSTANTSNDTTLRSPTTSTGPTLRPSNSEIRPFVITTRPSDDTLRPSTGTTIRLQTSTCSLYPSTTTDSSQVRLSEGISVVDDNDNLKVRKSNRCAVGEEKVNGKAGKGGGLRRVIRKVSSGLVFGNKDRKVSGVERKVSGMENGPPVPPKDAIRRK